MPATPHKPLYRRVVPETYAQLLYEYIELQGHKPEALIGRPWPSPSRTGLGGINVDDWQSMLEVAAEKLAEPFISLKIAKLVSPRHLGVMGSVLLACDNLGAALLRFEQYQRLIFDVIPMHTRIEGDWCEICWDISEHQPGFLVEQTGYAVIFEFARSLARGDVSPTEVRFSYPEPKDSKALHDFFACTLKFSDARPGARFSLGLLGLPLRAADPQMAEILLVHANRLLDQLPRQEEIVERVRREIAKALQGGEPKAETICGHLNLTHRTLHRRLANAGTNFRTELTVVRRELATAYLADPRLRILDVALLLGYSDHSAFTRAYKEWTGTAPKEIR